MPLKQLTSSANDGYRERSVPSGTSSADSDLSRLTLFDSTLIVAGSMIGSGIFTTEEEATLRKWLPQGTSKQHRVETTRIWKKRRPLTQRPYAGPAKWMRPDKLGNYSDETEKRVLKMLDQPPPKGSSQWNWKLLAQSLRDVSAREVRRILRGRGIRLRQQGGFSA